MCVARLHACYCTCRLGLHLSGKLATDTVVVGADVVKTPASELLGAVELSTYQLLVFIYVSVHLRWSLLAVFNTFQVLLHWSFTYTLTSY